MVLVLILLVFVLVLIKLPDDNLHIVTCDVGQGDAILIFKKNTQILIDGGPDNKVLNCLSRYMSFWDKRIELVILTHPQSDHFTGLIDVFRKYRVDMFLANQVDSSSDSYQVLKNEVRGLNLNMINPKTFMKLKIDNINMEILNPHELQDYLNKNVLGAFSTKEELNNFSIVTRFDYGSFSALTTGDMGPSITQRIIETNKTSDITFLKVPHHGSKNGLVKDLLLSVNPKIAVISVGAKNSYGHPSPEIIKMLEDEHIILKRTDLDHDIEVVTDGGKWWVN